MWVNSEQFQEVLQWFLVVLVLIPGFTTPASTADITSNKDAHVEGVTEKLFPSSSLTALHRKQDGQQTGEGSLGKLLGIRVRRTALLNSPKKDGSVTGAKLVKKREHYSRALERVGSDKDSLEFEEVIKDMPPRRVIDMALFRKEVARHRKFIAANRKKNPLVMRRFPLTLTGLGSQSDEVLDRTPSNIRREEQWWREINKDSEEDLANNPAAAREQDAGWNGATPGRIYENQHSPVLKYAGSGEEPTIYRNEGVANVHKDADPTWITAGNREEAGDDIPQIWNKNVAAVTERKGNQAKLQETAALRQEQRRMKEKYGSDLRLPSLMRPAEIIII